MCFLFDGGADPDGTQNVLPPPLPGELPPPYTL
jgi:hypothetical protein